MTFLQAEPATVVAKPEATSQPSVAVCIPVFNKRALTARFLESFSRVAYVNYRIVIIDDGSSDGTAAWLAAEHPSVVILRGDGNLWWTGGTNLGVEWALKEGFDFVLTINNDAEVAPDFLTRLVATAREHPRSIVGCRLNVLQTPNLVWCTGGEMNWQTGRILKLRETGLDEAVVLARNPAVLPVPILTGCGTLIPSACFAEIGLFDARWYPQYHADSEFMLRAQRSGWSVYCDLRALVWNDIVNTTSYTNRRDAIFSRRSFYFWRPMVAIHLKYCPPVWLPKSLWTQYKWLIPRLRGRSLKELWSRVTARG